MKTNLIQSCLLAAALALPASAQAQFGVTTTNGAITITSYTGPGGTITIPSAINGLPVTSIGNRAFWENESLTSVTIPDSVTSIGDFAFGLCTGMTNANLGNNITNIGTDAFAVSGLTSLTIPENLQVMGSSAFMGCNSLTSLIIPNNVRSVGLAAFEECLALTNVDIGDGVTNIGEDAFDLCSALTNVKIGRGVVVIGGGAFAGCSNLTSITIPDNVLDIQAHYFAFGEIGAFEGCSGLTNVTIGQGVTNIGEGAFAGCANLKSITIPGNVMSIGESAFADCSSSTNITVDPLNAYYSSVDGVLFDKGQTTLIQFPAGRTGTYAIPNSVTSLGEAAFGDCLCLSAIILDAGMTNSNAFLVFGLSGAFSGYYFKGDAPTGIEYYFLPQYTGATNATVYYLPGTAGWSNTFAGLPTALWLPQARVGDASFGVRTNQFGFNINWASGQTVVVEACTNLHNPAWSPVATNTLTSDSFYFSDLQWTNYAARFYRLRSP